MHFFATEAHCCCVSVMDPEEWYGSAPAGRLLLAFGGAAWRRGREQGVRQRGGSNHHRCHLGGKDVCPARHRSSV